ncbi:hypothetical protein Tco_0758001 [Tanacetum coccineum]
MFGFCRYNGIDNSENLIDSLNRVWIGKLCLHANIARFDRKEGFRPNHAEVKKHVPDASTLAKKGVNSSQSFINVVLFVFNDDRFLKHEIIQSWFSSLEPWHDDFVRKD